MTKAHIKKTRFNQALQILLMPGLLAYDSQLDARLMRVQATGQGERAAEGCVITKRSLVCWNSVVTRYFIDIL